MGKLNLRAVMKRITSHTVPTVPETNHYFWARWKRMIPRIGSTKASTSGLRLVTCPLKWATLSSIAKRRVELRCGMSLI
ncbi:MAG: hypothetical protein JRJ39_10250 [Deltaproteobacteria bacterium]|nr:hypothetical protein [Deltaproteobacteria bacterium]